LRHRQKVVFPQPLGPVRRMNSPSSTVTSRLLSAGSGAFGYVYQRSLASMIPKGSSTLDLGHF